MRRKSLKENLQNAITRGNSDVTSPKRDKKKHKSGIFTNKRTRSKKSTDRLVDSNDVATLIASVDNVKTPKGTIYFVVSFQIL